jgi:hypothetical protein
MISPYALRLSVCPHYQFNPEYTQTRLFAHAPYMSCTSHTLSLTILAIKAEEYELLSPLRT